MRLMCFGYGEAVATWHQTLYQAGQLQWCAASVRSPEKAKALKDKGIEAHFWNPEYGLDSDGLKTLAKANAIIISAAPDQYGDIIFPHINERLHYSSELLWLAYLSSTNVYGNHQGAWVHETTPLAPSGKRGLSRVKAEQQWLNSGLPAHVFRLAGIYGTKRNQINKLIAGRARRLIKPDHVFNRIHEADIAQTLSASWQFPNRGAIYNLADDLPAPPQDVLRYAAEICGAPLPIAEEYSSAKLTGLAAEFYLDNKRIENQKIKTELGIKLRYPNYKAGLNAIWQSMQTTA